jgi:ubiquinone/menaquinone biosynthesis C-methylase UbiE
MDKLPSQAGVSPTMRPLVKERRPRQRWVPRLVFGKNWDRHVAHAEDLSHTPGFERLRDALIAAAEPTARDDALDVGAGTGLLTLPLAARVDWVWAIDISPAMIDCLSSRALAAGLDNVQTAVVSATRLPLADSSIDLAMSNYCFHHLGAAGKRAALAELHRVLRPGGRLVFADMMFALRPATKRDRTVIASKISLLARRGPAGLWRLAKTGVRVLSFTGEHPAPTEWWQEALEEAGFIDVTVQPLAHEGGIAIAHKPR